MIVVTDIPYDKNVDHSAEYDTILPENTRLLLVAKQWLFYGKQESEGDGESYGHDITTKYVSRFSTQYAIGLVQAGNQVASKWLNTTLDNGVLLIDPVWGGMYSGSSNGDWVHPNYEKKLSVQANTIPLYLDAYALTGKPEYMATAEAMVKFMTRFLLSPEGVFYHGQSAKMTADKQDASYYKLNDSLRRSRGVPEIDKTVYANENGEAINALSAMYMISGNQAYLDQALTATKWMIGHLGTPEGGFKHSEAKNGGIYLSDNLQMAQAFISLYAVTTEPQYLMRAQRALDYINDHFQNPSGEPGFVAFVSDVIDGKTKYEVVAVDNTTLARVASLTSNYFADKKYQDMAKQALRYLVSPDVIIKNIPALVLIANDVITKPPLDITIIGKKNDPAAFELYFAALKFPSFYITYHWYTSAAESVNQTEVKFPVLSKAAAFFCAGGRCSLPLYNSEEFDTISKKLTEQQASKQPDNVISNISTLFPKYSLMRAQQAFTDVLISRNWTFIIIIFWMLGLLLAFTPCVFPLLLVLSTLLMSSSGLISHRRMLGLTLTYILSLATTYALLGYAAGALGIYLQLSLQSPFVIILMSVTLAVLAFSLLGAYKVHLPASIQHYFISFNSFRSSNTYLGAALMGIFLTLIASPCAAAPLIGVLSIISQIGDPLLGVVALFMMGIGMGTPLLFVWFTRETVLPRVQVWQHEIEIVLGLLILGLAIWMASRVIPYSYNMILWSGFAIVVALFMGVMRVTQEGNFGIFLKASSIMVFIYGIALMVGALIGNNNPFTPLAINMNVTQPYNPASLGIFQTIHSESELRVLLSQAQKQNRPVLLDFYASWCVSCIAIEKDIFTDPRVSTLMLNFTLVRVDLSSREPAVMAIAKKFDIVAPPAIVFFDAQGNELDTRLYGDMNVDEFVVTLTDVMERK